MALGERACAMVTNLAVVQYGLRYQGMDLVLAFGGRHGGKRDPAQQ